LPLSKPAFSQPIDEWYAFEQSKQKDGVDGDDEASEEDLPSRLSCKKWTVRWVVHEKMADEIDAEVKKVTGNELPSGHRAYIPHYPAAWSRVTNRLTDEQRSEFQALADKWTRMGPPRESQKRCVLHKNRPWLHLVYLLQRLAAKSLGQTAGIFLENIHHQMGAKAYLVIAFENPDDELKFIRFSDLFTPYLSSLFNK
jgi:hypothetical protein